MVGNTATVFFGTANVLCDGVKNESFADRNKDFTIMCRKLMLQCFFGVADVIVYDAEEQFLVSGIHCLDKFRKR